MERLNLKRIKKLIQTAKERSPLPEKVGAVLLHVKSGKYVLGHNHYINQELVHAEHHAFIQAADQFTWDELKELHLFTCRRPCVRCTEKAIGLGVQGVYYSLEQPEMGHLKRFTEKGITLYNYLTRPYATERVLRGEHDSSFV